MKSALIIVALTGLEPAFVNAQAEGNPEPTLKITFLANEGFLIQNADKSVLVDAFIKKEYYGYGKLPRDAYDRLVGGRDPFSGIQLALTSHVHQDHFQIEPAIDFLQANPKCEFLSTEQVALKIREDDTASGVQQQVISVWPDDGKISELEKNGVRLELFRLRHANPRNYRIQNLGFIIRMGNLTVLHVGDAESRNENFEPLDLPERNVDVAILPYWMFAKPKLVSEQVGAKKYVAAHIPVIQTEQIKRRFAKQYPDVIVFEKSMQQWDAETGDISETTWGSKKGE